MKKKIVISAIIVFIMLSSVAFAAVNGSFDGFQIVKLKYDGKELKPKSVPGILYKGTTLVPIGLLRDAGFDVTWDPKTLTADVKEKKKQNNTSNVLQTVLNLGGTGISFFEYEGKTIAESSYYQITDFANDWNNMFHIIDALSKTGVEQVQVHYVDSKGKTIQSVAIDSQTLIDYANGKISVGTVESRYIVDGGQNVKTPLSAKEIAKLSDRVGYVYSFDANDKMVSTGSGFMIDTGVFITNDHVGSNGGGISVQLDGAFYDTLGWYLFKNSITDVYGTILSTRYDNSGKAIGSSPTKTLPYTTKLPEIGDKVYSIGNPNGLTNTLQEGIVSAIRDIDGVQYIQHTADTEAGSSGGVLLNEYGEAIGITTSGIPGTTYDFAVPMMYVQVELDRFN